MKKKLTAWDVMLIVFLFCVGFLAEMRVYIVVCSLAGWRSDNLWIIATLAYFSARWTAWMARGWME